MAIYEITGDGFAEIEATNFATEQFYERTDMQGRLLRDIGVILPDVLVIAEEYGEWEDSRRRIDLLGVDRDGSLVVIELKRDNEGAHMELQALRYAAMISKMTFQDAAYTYGELLRKLGDPSDAEDRLRAHISAPGLIEENFGKKIKIVLVSANFGKELTTAVMWLNEVGLDIRCIRMMPYKDGERMLIDVQPIIPLPEAEDYQIRIRRKQQSEQQERNEVAILRRFWEQLALLSNARTDLRLRMSTAHRSYLTAASGLGGLDFAYVANRNDFRVDLYISRTDAETSKQIFGQLLANRSEIEAAFGGNLSWEELPERRASRVAARIDFVGDRDDESNWPEIHEALISAMERFKPALAPFIRQIG